MLHTILPLERPLISIDLETTGIHVKNDRIIQIGVCKLYPNGDYKEWSTYVNPTIPIPPEASAANHITDEMVKSAPKFFELHLKVIQAMANCDLLGYNLGNYDVPLLCEEYLRCGVAWKPPFIVDGFRMWSRFYPRNLTAFIHEFALKDAEGNPVAEIIEEFTSFKAHDALHDARWTMKAAKGFFERTQLAPRSVKELHDMFFVKPRDAGSLDPDGKVVWINNEACISFGNKHAGHSLRSIAANDRGYLEWILRGTFNNVVKTLAQNALQGKFPAP